jgi:hypothetical protein
MLSGRGRKSVWRRPRAQEKIPGVRREKLIVRSEVVALLFAVNDAVDELRKIRELLEKDEDGEEEEDT